MSQLFPGVGDEAKIKGRLITLAPVRQAEQVRNGTLNLLHPPGWRIRTYEVKLPAIFSGPHFLSSPVKDIYID